MDLDDVVQDVFLKVQTNLGNFRGEAQLTTWLFQVTRNVVGHRRRKDRVRRWLAGTGTEVAGELACPALEPLAKVERRQSAEMLYRARAQLSRQLQQMSVTEEAR